MAPIPQAITATPRISKPVAHPQQNDANEIDPIEQESPFANSICSQKITLPQADFDAFVDALGSDYRPDDNLIAGAEWFKQNGF